MKNLLEKVFVFIGDIIIGDKNKNFNFSFYKQEEDNNKQSDKNIFIKQVWIDGKFWTIMANSEKELKEKTDKVVPDVLVFKEKEEINILNNFYTEIEEHEDNDWLKKRDVWINEYYEK